MINLSAYNKTKFQPRTRVIEVPTLADFVGKGEKPTIKVRGLEGNEWSKVREAETAARDMASVVDSIATGEVAQAIKGILGTAENVTTEVARRICILTLGCVEPEIDQQTAVKLMKTHPVDMFSVTDQITTLTAMGHEVGKPKGS